MSRIALRAALSLLAVAALAGVATAQGIETWSGQKIAAGISGPGESLVFRFDAVAGDALTLKIAGSRKEGFVPFARIVAPTGAEVAVPAAVKGKIALKKQVLPATGLYYLFLAGADGTTGSFKLALKLKAAKPAPATFAMPGDYVLPALHTSTLTIVAKAAKGATVAPRITSIRDALGREILDGASLKETTKSVKLSGFPIPMSGPVRVRIEADSGVEGDPVTVKAKVKAPKGYPKKLGPDDLIDSQVFKVSNGQGYYGLTAEVYGDDVRSVTLVAPDGSENALEEEDSDWSFDAGYGSQGELDAAWPDGLYLLRIGLAAGGSFEQAFPIGGAWPEPVTIDADLPDVTWTGGAGALGFYLDLHDSARDEDIGSVLLPASASSHSFPADLVHAGMPYELELSAVSPGRKVVLVEAEQQGSTVTYNAVMAIGDLATFTLDFSTLRFDSSFVEGVYAGYSNTGTLTPQEGWDGYVFTATDDQFPDETSDLILLPGELVVASDPDGNVAVGVPALDTNYTLSEIVGVYDYLRMVCPDPEADCDFSYGTFEIVADGTWRVWDSRPAGGTPDLGGTWTDQGNGVIRTFDGAEHVGNLLVAPAPGGGRMFLYDDKEDHGIVVGVRQAEIAAGDADGTYAVLETGEDAPFRLQVDGTTIRDEEESLRFKLNDPFAGFVSGGDEEEGFLALPTGFGVLFYGSWWEEDGETFLSVGAGVRER